MEVLFILILIAVMAYALGSGYPVAFALPGSAIFTIALASLVGYLLTGSVDTYFSHGGPGQWLSAGVTNFRGIYWEAERDTLIAIPLFVFMGIMLQRSKIAEDLLVTMAQLFGPIPGGLGISVVFVGALLAATTGIVGATVVAMGLISLPAMLRNRYSPALATGTIAASGTLGQIIPPSIVLIILADQLASAVDQASTTRQALYKASTGELSMPADFALTSTSAGEMFLGALVPGLILVGLYMLFILGFALMRPSMAPAVPRESGYDRAFAWKVFITLMPPLALIFLVLGSIILGIATVNQAGAIGAIGAMVMAGYRLREGERGAYTPAILAILAILTIGVILAFHTVNIKRIETSQDVLALVLALIAVSLLLFAIFWSGWRTLNIQETLRGVMIETAKTTSLVFIILIGAAMLTAAFRSFGGEDLVREFLQSMPGGFWSQFVIVMLVIFVLGFFLDFIEIAVVVVPIVAPILLADPSANVTAVWLGVMIGLNIQTSFLTPPFGFALFYLRGVAPPTVKTLAMYKGVVAFITLQLIALAIVGLNPALVNYLPNRVSLLSETAPPPKNPRLQVCMEAFAAEQYAADGDKIAAAIDAASKLDLSVLPKDTAGELAESFEKAGRSMALMDEIAKAGAAIDEATPGYQPMHHHVRALERDIRRLDARVHELELIVRRSGPNGIYSQERGKRAAEQIEELKARRETMAAGIPGTWKDASKAFNALQKEDQKARLAYRRNIDQAYEPLVETMETIRAGNALEAMRADFDALDTALASGSADDFLAMLEPVRATLGDIPGASDIRSAINDARKAMRGTPDKPRAQAAIAEARRELEAEIAWRERAQTGLLPQLETYDAVIRDTVGLRGQPVLPRRQALYVAGCTAHHRDVSLSF